MYMSQIHWWRGPVLALLAGVCACGPDWGADGNVDPYNGVIDNSFGAPATTGTQTTPSGALAEQFQPFTPSRTADRVQCNGASSCYLPQIGFAKGKQVKFFYAGKNSRPSKTGPTPFMPVSCAVPDTTVAGSGFGCVYPAGMADHGTDGGGGFHTA